MSNTLAYIYRIATAIVAAQGLIIGDLGAFNLPARWISGGFGGIALVGLLAEFAINYNPTTPVNTDPPAPKVA